MRNGPYELVIPPADYPGKRYRGRYCYEHHLIWWQHTGTLPGPGELIHHKNEQKRDNRFDNFELKTIGEHTADHNRDRRQPRLQIPCDRCGTVFEIRIYEERIRRENSKSGKLFCGRSCQVSQQQEDRKSFQGSFKAEARAC